MFLGSGAQIGGSFHLRLNIGEKPIAKKYREGKMKRTSKGGLKLPETVERESIGDLLALRDAPPHAWLFMCKLNF